MWKRGFREGPLLLVPREDSDEAGGGDGQLRAGHCTWQTTLNSSSLWANTKGQSRGLCGESILTLFSCHFARFSPKQPILPQTTGRKYFIIWTLGITCSFQFPPTFQPRKFTTAFFFPSRHFCGRFFLFSGYCFSLLYFSSLESKKKSVF